jgi:hypothetical protein
MTIAAWAVGLSQTAVSSLKRRGQTLVIDRLERPTES